MCHILRCCQRSGPSDVDLISGGLTHPTKALRGQILVAAVIVLFLIGLQGDLGRQIDDVLVRAADGPWPAVLATLLMLTTCAALLIGGAQCLHAYIQQPTIEKVGSFRGAIIAVIALVLQP